MDDSLRRAAAVCGCWHDRRSPIAAAGRQFRLARRSAACGPGQALGRGLGAPGEFPVSARGGGLPTTTNPALPPPDGPRPRCERGRSSRRHPARRQGRTHLGDGDPEAACAGGWLQSLRCSASACLPLRLLGASSALPFSICVDPTGSWAAMRLVHQQRPGALITTTMSAEVALRVQSTL